MGVCVGVPLFWETTIWRSSFRPRLNGDESSSWEHAAVPGLGHHNMDCFAAGCTLDEVDNEALLHDCQHKCQNMENPQEGNL